MGHEQQISLRHATLADRNGVDALLSRSYPALLAQAYAPEVMAVAMPIFTRIRPELLCSGSYWVAARGGQIVAAGGWTAHDPSGQPAPAESGHIRHVATDPDCLRMRIGTALLGAVMGEARAAGKAHMICISTLPAIGFYQALGFTVISPQDIVLPDGTAFPSMRMQCAL